MENSKRSNYLLLLVGTYYYVVILLGAAARAVSRRDEKRKRLGKKNLRKEATHSLTLSLPLKSRKLNSKVLFFPALGKEIRDAPGLAVEAQLTRPLPFNTADFSL